MDQVDEGVFEMFSVEISEHGSEKKRIWSFGCGDTFGNRCLLSSLGCREANQCPLNEAKMNPVKCDKEWHHSITKAHPCHLNIPMSHAIVDPSNHSKFFRVVLVNISHAVYIFDKDACIEGCLPQPNLTRRHQLWRVRRVP